MMVFTLKKRQQHNRREDIGQVIDDIIKAATINRGQGLAYTETSGQRASEIVLSGNGFLAAAAPGILASLAGVPVLMPADPGAASLRGAAVCAFRALGRKVPRLKANKVRSLDDPHLAKRYQRYKELRRQI